MACVDARFVEFGRSFVEDFRQSYGQSLVLGRFRRLDFKLVTFGFMDGLRDDLNISHQLKEFTAVFPLD